jgi:hypothetical protein
MLRVVSWQGRGPLLATLPAARHVLNARQTERPSNERCCRILGSDYRRSSVTNKISSVEEVVLLHAVDNVDEYRRAWVYQLVVAG